MCKKKTINICNNISHWNWTKSNCGFYLNFFMNDNFNQIRLFFDFFLLFFHLLSSILMSSLIEKVIYHLNFENIIFWGQKTGLVQRNYSEPLFVFCFSFNSTKLIKTGGKKLQTQQQWQRIDSCDPEKRSVCDGYVLMKETWLSITKKKCLFVIYVPASSHVEDCLFS